MEQKLVDKVKQHNDSQRYTQKIRKSAEIKAKFDQFANNIETNVKKAISFIPEIPGKIKTFIETKKVQNQENQQVLDAYASFLNFAELSKNNTGVDFDPEFGNIKVVYTNFGPLFIEELSNNIQSIEGFIPTEDSIMKYFNGQLQSQPQNNLVNMTGKFIDPESLKISTTNTTLPIKNNKVLFYLKKQEELAKKKSEQSSEQEKQ